MSRSARSKGAPLDGGAQSASDVVTGAGEGTSTQANAAVALEVGTSEPVPAVGAGDVGELMRAMTAMFETFSRQMGTAPNVVNAAPTSVPRPRLSVPTPSYSG